MSTKLTFKYVSALIFLFFVLVLWVIRGDSHVVAHTGSASSSLVATNPALLDPGPVTFALIIMSMGDVAAAKILIKVCGMARPIESSAE